MVATAVTAFFYLRIVVVMYFAEPVTSAGPAQVPVSVSAAAEETGGQAGSGSAAPAPAARPALTDAPFVVVPGVLTVIVIAVAVIVTLGLGLFPGPVLDWLTVPLPMLS
jgi:NADH-quinone oxidoreductase subunit N